MTDLGEHLTKEAKNLYLSFAESFVSKMVEWASVSGIPQVQDVRLIFKQGGTEQQIVSEPSFWKLLIRNDPDFAITTESAVPAVKAHLRAGIMKPPELSDAAGIRIADPTFDQIKPVLARNLLDAVMRSVEKGGALVFDPQQFESIYQLYVADWTSTSRRNKALVPLLNLTSCTELRFGPTLELAVMEDDEKTRLYGLFGFHKQVLGEYILFSRSRYKLVGSYYDDEKEGPGFGHLLVDVFDVISAFRLLKSGTIGLTVLFTDLNPVCVIFMVAPA
jgi:hypothetical protein